MRLSGGHTRGLRGQLSAGAAWPLARGSPLSLSLAQRSSGARKKKLQTICCRPTKLAENSRCLARRLSAPMEAYEGGQLEAKNKEPSERAIGVGERPEAGGVASRNSSAAGGGGGGEARAIMSFACPSRRAYFWPPELSLSLSSGLLLSRRPPSLGFALFGRSSVRAFVRSFAWPPLRGRRESSGACKSLAAECARQKAKCERPYRRRKQSGGGRGRGSKRAGQRQRQKRSRGGGRGRSRRRQIDRQTLKTDEND